MHSKTAMSMWVWVWVVCVWATGAKGVLTKCVGDRVERSGVFEVRETHTHTHIDSQITLIWHSFAFPSQMKWERVGDDVIRFNVKANTTGMCVRVWCQKESERERRIKSEKLLVIQGGLESDSQSDNIRWSHYHAFPHKLFTLFQKMINSDYLVVSRSRSDSHKWLISDRYNEDLRIMPIHEPQQDGVLVHASQIDYIQTGRSASSLPPSLSLSFSRLSYVWPSSCLRKENWHGWHAGHFLFQSRWVTLGHRR